MIPSTDDPRRDLILQAAFERFVNYGFKRTSMEDIAVAARMSRPALYQHYRNKADIFRAFVTGMKGVMVDEVREALFSDHPFAERLFDAFDRGILRAHREIAATPHGDELMGLNKEVAGELFNQWLLDLEAALRDGLIEAQQRGEFFLTDGGLDHAAVARLMVNTVEGIKTRAQSLDKIESEMRALVELIVAAGRR
ncbi:MAG: TetR/AcrR family transcriptional regulator [Hyphomicrobiales bacterium]|nr:TetR/AcrR family transcriptional regulator [Hyphomicrobiales bacterium]MCP4998481.1 TetR/AcrR family transcriptional regulator [Hyphomicrobiales bacterium]